MGTQQFLTVKKLLAVNDDGDGNGGKLFTKMSTDLTNKAHWTDVSNSPNPLNSLIRLEALGSSPSCLPLCRPSWELFVKSEDSSQEGENLHRRNGARVLMLSRETNKQIKEAFGWRDIRWYAPMHNHRRSWMALTEAPPQHLWRGEAPRPQNATVQEITGTAGFDCSIHSFFHSLNRRCLCFCFSCLSIVGIQGVLVKQMVICLWCREPVWSPNP